MSDNDYAIFLNGTFGVGKSSVLDHLGDQLASRGQAFSLMDVDWFHRSWPLAEFDPENTVVEARNIAAVSANYRSAGARRFVLAGVMRDGADQRRYHQALQVPLRSVLLTADAVELDRRLRSRYPDSRSDHLDWHLHRFESLQEQLLRSTVNEYRLDTTHRPPNEVAAEVLSVFGL